MTGAEKFMLGMFAGGWKFGGKLGRPSVGVSACCMPGGAAVPGAAMPGGGAGEVVSTDLSLWSWG